MRYDVKFVDVVLNGIKLDQYGDTVASYSTSGDFIEMQKGQKGDAVTHIKHDYIEQFKSSLLVPNYSHLEQIRSWGKNGTTLTFQGTDGNTGKKRSSTTAYIQNLGDETDGNQVEFNIQFEELI